jgi:hypothetical protein
MKCNDLHTKISQYVDGYLEVGEHPAIELHLSECPLCREYSEDLRSLRLNLSRLGRPELTLPATNRIKLALRSDIRGNRTGISHDMREWIQMSLMPMSIGVAATLVIGLSFLTLMFNAANGVDETARYGDSQNDRFLLASNKGPYSGFGPREISPIDFARTRLEFAGESPSINPQGALVDISHELLKNRPTSDEVVVVADVFSNGLAQIAEVVEPTNNSRVLNDLQRAMDGDLGDAPFVPAVIDNRSASVRVVLKFQSVNVSARPNRRKK